MARGGLEGQNNTHARGKGRKTMQQRVHLMCPDLFLLFRELLVLSWL